MRDRILTEQASNTSEQPMRSAEVSLITKERSQKLDLLVHLISNLKQSLVICGPSGIGKTTLLNEFKKQSKDIYPIHTIQASSDLNFESIQEILCKFLIRCYTEYRNHELKSLLTMLKKQDQKVVIIIDDAGLLVPGLVTSLVQFATAYPILRIVFSLTHDGLHIKNSSDPVVNDCHFIEIPPLTEKQCGVFLQNMSSHPDAVVSFNAISDLLVEKLYRETHGIPGEIISELPTLSNYQGMKSYKWIYATIGLIALVVVGSKVFILNESGLKPTIEKNKTTLLLKPSKEVVISAPVVNQIAQNTQPNDEYQTLTSVQKEESVVPFVSPENDNNIDSEINSQLGGKQVTDQIIQESSFSNVLLIKGQNIDKDAVVSVIDKKIIKDDSSVAVVQNVIEVSKKEEPKPKKIERKKTEKDDDRHWLLSQPGKNYTIQLMVLSKLESVDAFIKKQQQGIKKRLKYFQITNQNQKKYILIYGSFENKSLATKKMKLLPAKYRNSWVRKLNKLQKKINN